MDHDDVMVVVDEQKTVVGEQKTVDEPKAVESEVVSMTVGGDGEDVNIAKDEVAVKSHVSDEGMSNTTKEVAPSTTTTTTTTTSTTTVANPNNSYINNDEMNIADDDVHMLSASSPSKSLASSAINVVVEVASEEAIEMLICGEKGEEGKVEEEDESRIENVRDLVDNNGQSSYGAMEGEMSVPVAGQEESQLQPQPQEQQKPQVHEQEQEQSQEQEQQDDENEETTADEEDLLHRPPLSLFDVLLSPTRHWRCAFCGGHIGLTVRCAAPTCAVRAHPLCAILSSHNTVPGTASATLRVHVAPPPSALSASSSSTSTSSASTSVSSSSTTSERLDKLTTNDCEGTTNSMNNTTVCYLCPLHNHTYCKDTSTYLHTIL